MTCTRCGQDAGDAGTCPACGGPTASTPDPQVPTPEGPPVTSAIPGRLRSWRQTLVVLGIAVALGLVAGWLVKTRLAPGPAPECEQLCAFAEIPMVASNPNWQQQVQQFNCRCNAMQRKNAPPMQPVDRPHLGH